MGKIEKSDTDQPQFWQMVLETFKSSGHSIRQFCRQEGLPEASFYSWRKKITKTLTSDSDKEAILSRSLLFRCPCPKPNPEGWNWFWSRARHCEFLPEWTDRH